jgi:hypothetical protein
MTVKRIVTNAVAGCWNLLLRRNTPQSSVPSEQSRVLQRKQWIVDDALMW